MAADELTPDELLWRLSEPTMVVGRDGNSFVVRHVLVDVGNVRAPMSDRYEIRGPYGQARQRKYHWLAGITNGETIMADRGETPPPGVTESAAAAFDALCTWWGATGQA